MNAELDRLRKEMTRETFIEIHWGKGCPQQYGLSGICDQHHGYHKCYKQCYTDAVKDIQFKDDINPTVVQLEPWPENDKVNHPSHYCAGKYEVIDIIESIVNSMALTPYQGYLLGNVIKYIARFKHKGGAEDLKKANVYLDKLTKAVGE